jgi:hypothetical protein
LKREEKEIHYLTSRVHIFTEDFVNEFGRNHTAYAAVQKSDAMDAEECMCGDPYKCVCQVIEPPTTQAFDKMVNSLFVHPRPMLMFTIQLGEITETRYTYFCKLEKEVREEIVFLNNMQKDGRLQWKYIEEERYNSAAKTDYRDFCMKFSERDYTDN